MWAGVTAGKTDRLADDFNSSIRFDSRMARQDITGSIAHAAMLAAKGIISEADCDALTEGLAGILEDLESGKIYGYCDSDIMQSASVVKVFIMGAVYQYICYPDAESPEIPYQEAYEGQLRDLIGNMITVSDNNAANALVEILGQGDYQRGAEIVGEFCKRYGYTATSIGRRFLESNPSGDNYTSASDCRKILSDICAGRLVNGEASAKMLAFLKNQTRKGKIPAGLPQGYSSANKTGEMPEGYGLGCIENDMAVVFPPEGMGKGYILVILSDHLGGDNYGAAAAFVNMSSETAGWYAAEHNSAAQ